MQIRKYFRIFVGELRKEAFMCMYKIAVNDELLQRTRQTFADERRMDAWLQQQVEALLLNYNAQQTAIRQKARAAVEAMRNQSELNGNSGMSLEDINREIQQARQARRVMV